jgi:hypothetical protein
MLPEPNEWDKLGYSTAKETSPCPQVSMQCRLKDHSVRHFAKNASH